MFVTSHPIQYQVPVFRCLTESGDVKLTVLFAQIPDGAVQGAGFGVAFEWDIPLLDGYQYRTLHNVAASPSVTRFSGCDTPEIGDVLKAIRPDVVVINGWVVKTCLQALWACKRLGIPCAVRGEANNLRQRPWWKQFLQRQLVRQYDACLPIGKANREFYLRLGVSEDRLFDCPYCIENDRFAEASRRESKDRELYRQQWKIPSGRLCLLYCGKFEAKKHPVELIQCVARAVAQGADLHLLMVGTGDLLSECQNLVETQQLPVSFAGFLNQSQIIHAYVAADVLVLPSDSGETWGLVVNEAMACGMPAIVSDQVGCVADLIVEGQTGWVFRFGDTEQLANLLLKLCTESESLHEMTYACRETVSNYSPTAAAQGIAAAARTLSADR